MDDYGLLRINPLGDAIRRGGSQMKVNRLFVVAITAALVPAAQLLAKETPDFTYSPKPGLAGRALLTGNGFLLFQNLGTANFSPELRLPLQLVYDSSRAGQGGIFGHGWYCPQLESTISPDKGGMVWTAPWGEQVGFVSRRGLDREALEIYGDLAAGRAAFFAPHADWEAGPASSSADASQTGDWNITGTRAYAGWAFTYRGGRLMSIAAPSGKSLAFAYAGRGALPVSVSQSGKAFIEISPARDGLASSVKVNGIETRVFYSDLAVPVLPKTLQGAAGEAVRAQAVTLERPGLAPVELSYGPAGYLSRVRHGDFIEHFEVEAETPAERLASLRAVAAGRQDSPKRSGRLLSDGAHAYAYGGGNTGNVSVTDKAGRTARYDFKADTGVLAVTDFAGQKSTYYYYMRHDVAYLGWLRQVVDAKGRVAASYRYDPVTAKPTRFRDMAGNDINVAYTASGAMESVTRRAASARDAEPVLRVRHDAQGNPVEISRLDAQGRPAQSTRVTYNAEGRPTLVDDGCRRTSFIYNAYGYPTQVTDTFGQASAVEYDAYNRPVRATSPDGITASYAWNASGQLAKAERRDSAGVMSSLEVEYDRRGLPSRMTDHNGRVKAVDRDALGRVVREGMPGGVSIAYAYDAAGRLSSVLDPEGNELAFGWSASGLDSLTTAEGQVTSYARDPMGAVKTIASHRGDPGKADRAVKYEHDRLDRLTRADYGNGQVQEFAYDDWGRVTSATRGDRKATYQYDHFGRLTRKTDGAVTETYEYDNYGRRTSRVTQDGALTLTEKRAYDRFGRLTSITSPEGTLEYAYDSRGRVATQTVNGRAIRYAYTPHGQVASKSMAPQGLSPAATLTYTYSRDGAVLSRALDGDIQRYFYDSLGRLTAVRDAGGNPVEEYAYDPRGNITKKTVAGVTTEYTYDKANQLVSSQVAHGVPAVPGGAPAAPETTTYAYDAAGRLTREGAKSYTYGYLDKVMSVSEGTATSATFSYAVSGQLATATRGNATESFLWDGLALIHRDGVNYLNEPHPGGGAPIVAAASLPSGSRASERIFFNDLLGTTAGTFDSNGEFASTSMTTYGDDASQLETRNSQLETFFTGKPHVAGLGHAFLLRNYRPDLGKWPTADPLGYPDGLNNFAYVNGRVTSGVDWLGAQEMNPYSWGDAHFVAYYFIGLLFPNTPTSFDLDDIGLTYAVWQVIAGTGGFLDQIRVRISEKVEAIVRAASSSGSGGGTFSHSQSGGGDFGSICFSMGGASLSAKLSVDYIWIQENNPDGTWTISFMWGATGTIDYSDAFAHPLNITSWREGEIFTVTIPFLDITYTFPNPLDTEVGRPYSYAHRYNPVILTGAGSITE